MGLVIIGSYLSPKNVVLIKTFRTVESRDEVVLICLWKDELVREGKLARMQVEPVL